MTPVPVTLSIVFFRLGTIVVFPVVLGCIDTMLLAFLAVSCRVVIMSFVAIGPSGLRILGAQRSRRH